MASIRIIEDNCAGCENCLSACPFGAIAMNEAGTAQILDNCTLCGSCADSCQFEALEFSADEAVERDISAYHGIWVFCEQYQGRLRQVGLELLGQARGLADELGTELTAVVCGGKRFAEDAPLLCAHGADQVLLVENELLDTLHDLRYTQAMTAMVNKYQPSILLLGATSFGRSFAPRLAARLNTGLTADCTVLEADKEQGLLLQTRPAFGGNLMATIICPHHRPQMATVRPKVFTPLPADMSRETRLIVEPVALDEQAAVNIIERIAGDQEGGVNIAEADIIIAVGKGVGNAKNIALAEELARLLGGAVAVSRPLVDLGWYGYSHQVGQTGKTVAPRLYLALGISGAVQHLAGIAAETVVAVNNDPDAPIFSHAHYCVQGDCIDFLHTLIETVREKGFTPAD